MSSSCSLNTTVSQFAPMSAAGLTQASMVKPFVRSSDDELATVTQLDVPLKASAPPNLPVDQVVSRVAPVFGAAIASCTTVPLPSSKPYAATSPPLAARGAVDVTRANTTATSVATRAVSVLQCILVDPPRSLNPIPGLPPVERMRRRPRGNGAAVQCLLLRSADTDRREKAVCER